MCKKILRNEKGLSLVEVVVASAISIIIAMGVMQINENAQKGIQSIQSRDDKLQFKRMLVRELADPTTCVTAMGGINTDVSANIAFPDGTTNFNNLGAGSFVDNELLGMANSYKVDAVRLTAFTGASVVGSCILEIDLWEFKVHRDATNKNVSTLRVPLICQVDNTTDMLLQSCSATDTQEHGEFNLKDKESVPGEYYLHAKGDGTGTGDNYIFGSSFYADPAGPQNEYSVLSSLLTLSPDSNHTWGVVSNVNQALAIGSAVPGEVAAITFGNDDEVGLYYDPSVDGFVAPASPTYPALTGPSNTLSTNEGFLVGQDLLVGNNIHAVNKVTTATVEAVTGNIENINAINGVFTNLTTNNPLVTLSDERYKKEIETIRSASESLEELRGVTYFMRRDEFPDRKFSEELQHGLIAQEVEKIFPNLVYTDHKSGYKGVKYISIIPILIEAFKEQQAEIAKNKEMFHIMKEGLEVREAKQNARIEALERENKQLRKELDELKEQVRKIILKE